MYLVEKFKTSIDWVDLIIKAEKNFPDYEIFTEPNLEEVQNECEFIFYPIGNYSDLEAVFKLDGKEDGSSIDVKYGKKTTTVIDTEQLFEFISQSSPFSIAFQADSVPLNLMVISPQKANDIPPIYVTSAGRVTVLSESENEKVLLSILVIPSGTTTSRRLSQLEKQPIPMLSIHEGISIVLIDLPSNEEAPR